MLSGMTATSIGPDSNQVLQALGKLKWLCVMDSLPTTSSEFWHAPGIDPAKVADRGLRAAGHALDREGRVVHQQRPLGAVEGRRSCRPRASPGTTTGSWPSCSLRVRELYRQQGGKFPDPVHGRSRCRTGIRRKPELDEIAQEINGKDLTIGQAARDVRSPQRTTARTTRGRLDLHRALPGERQPDQAPRRRPGPGAATTRPAWASTRTGRGAGRRTAACSTTAPRPTRSAGRGIRSGPASSGTRGQKLWVGDVPDYPADGRPDATRRRRCRSS